MFEVGQEYVVKKHRGGYDAFNREHPIGSTFKVEYVDSDGDGCDKNDNWYITEKDVTEGYLELKQEDSKWIKIENEEDVLNNHQHYFKHWNGKLDIYRVIDLWEINDPCFQHALKKIMCAGQRGHKDLKKDIQDIIDTMTRKLEMMEEDLETSTKDN